MSGKVAEIESIIGDTDSLARNIATMFVDWNNRRDQHLQGWQELRNYIFATDTTTTSNATLPWKNKTTLPKLTQIRDNLQANYMDALFPNDGWLKWEAYTKDADTLTKRQAIEAYMQNKVRISEFKKECEKLLLDWIDTGNCFAEVTYEENSKTLEDTGETIQGYIGPKLRRVSPYDIVFNPIAPSFRETPKIIRYVKTIGELEKDLRNNPELGYAGEVIQRSKDVRAQMTHVSPEDRYKDIGYQIDGFTSLYDYYMSGTVEILEFHGDIHDPLTGDYLEDRIITVIDRVWVVRSVPNPSWLMHQRYHHVAWRERSDNIYGMSPLANLVGLQYRVDHLENLKADAMDLTVHPPIKVVGDVEPFNWGPGEPIIIDNADGDVQPLPPNAAAFQVNNELAYYLQLMEEYAGAPREAMGIRSPGEKTAFEVQSLLNAAGRIFQNKTKKFEKDFLEPVLNAMLETSRRNLNGINVVKVMDDDIGVATFVEVTKEDITAEGKLLPVGASHFAARNQLVQNILGIFNSAVGQKIDPHVSSKGLASLVEDAFQLSRYQLVQPNIALAENAESTKLASALEKDVLDNESVLLDQQEQENLAAQAELEGAPDA